MRKFDWEFKMNTCQQKHTALAGHGLGSALKWHYEIKREVKTEEINKTREEKRNSRKQNENTWRFSSLLLVCEWANGMA